MDLCEQLDWIDVDKENENVLFYVTEYVNDIFSYYKEREVGWLVMIFNYYFYNKDIEIFILEIFEELYLTYVIIIIL